MPRMVTGNLSKKMINIALVKSIRKPLFNAKQVCKWNISVNIDPSEVSFTGGYVEMMRSLREMNEC
jgi:hypothetical protein